VDFILTSAGTEKRYFEWRKYIADRSCRLLAGTVGSIPVVGMALLSIAKKNVCCADTGRCEARSP
jgi:hypothetical protein